LSAEDEHAAGAQPWDLLGGDLRAAQVSWRGLRNLRGPRPLTYRLARRTAWLHLGAGVAASVEGREVVARRVLSGEVVWRVDAGGHALLGVAGGSIVTMSRKGPLAIDALAVATGARRRLAELEADSASLHSVWPERDAMDACVGNRRREHRRLRIRPADGTVEDVPGCVQEALAVEVPGAEGVFSTRAFGDGTILVKGSHDQGLLLDLQSGAIRGRTLLRAQREAVFTSGVFVVDDDDARELVALDGSWLAPLWNRSEATPVKLLATADALLEIELTGHRDRARGVTARDPVTGDELSRVAFPRGALPSASAVLLAGKLFFPNADPEGTVVVVE
jgi:hypothetical protein